MIDKLITWGLMLVVLMGHPGVEQAAPPEPAQTMTMTATAYCACQRCCGKYPGDPAYGITATGTRATQGRTIAVDPQVIPLGSEVYIDGQGPYYAEDTGVKGSRIDIYFDRHEDAIVFGVREVTAAWR